MKIKNRFEKLQNKFLNKKFIDVISESKKLIKKFPEEIYLYNICGLSLQFIGKNLEAIIYFKKAIEIDNKNYVVKINLANSQKNLGDYSEAEKNYLEAIKNQPNNSSFLSYYAIFKSHLLENKEAIELFKKALKYSKNNLSLLGNLATAYQKIGDFINSKKICKKIFKINPNFVKAHIILNIFTDYKNNQKYLEELLRLNNNKYTILNDKISICFALGKAHEDIKKYDKAFQYFNQANYLVSKINNYNIRKEKKLFESIEKTFRDYNNLKIVNKGKKIIFIVGLPRSGTTLVEQIISSHKNVSAAGELNYLDNIINTNFLIDNKINKNKFVKEINSGNNILNDKYNKFLKSYKFNNDYVTDKTPLNFKWIGFIKTFFPNSKIIICNRNINDTFVSIFKNNFTSAEMSWAFDAKNISEYIKLYYEITNFFKNLYGDAIFNLDYENLINNSNNEIRNLIKFCGLSWDVNCLSPQKNYKSSISTASSFQARKPIYNTSIKTSNLYDKYLNKYFNNN